MMKLLKMTTMILFYFVAMSSFTLAAPVVADSATPAVPRRLRAAVAATKVPDFVAVIGQQQDERQLYRDTSCCVNCMPYAKGSCPYQCCTTHTPHVGH
jgi:hypothetical protein